MLLAVNFSFGLGTFTFLFLFLLSFFLFLFHLFAASLSRKQVLYSEKVLHLFVINALVHVGACGLS